LADWPDAGVRKFPAWKSVRLFTLFIDLKFIPFIEDFLTASFLGFLFLNHFLGYE